jgi:hypothetical protein
LLDAAIRQYPEAKKKADVTEHLAVLGHVGLLVNGPPDSVGLPFV